MLNEMFRYFPDVTCLKLFDALLRSFVPTAVIFNICYEGRFYNKVFFSATAIIF